MPTSQTRHSRAAWRLAQLSSLGVAAATTHRGGYAAAGGDYHERMYSAGRSADQ
jgi:hypothetical protein